MARALLFFLLFFACALQAQDSKLIAASCHADGGRCSGTAYCSACSNCSGCKHCNSGGTCGVCTSYAAPVKKTYSKPAKKRASTSATPTASGYKKNSSRKTASSKAPAAKSLQGFAAPAAPRHAAGDKLTVASDILNLREGAGMDFPVIETLEKGATVQLLGYDGEWVQVVVVKTKNVGYVKVAFLR